MTHTHTKKIKKNKKPELLIQPNTKIPKFKQLGADQELFLSVFEKPGKIYRFLRTGNAVQPAFQITHYPICSTTGIQGPLLKRSFKLGGLRAAKFSVSESFIGTGYNQYED